MCTGCQKRFCAVHHQEHRKLIEKDFEGLIEQHNVFRQNLYSESNDNNNRTLKLLKTIDSWEKETIANVKTTAAATRTRITKIMNEEKDQLKNKFKSMGDELRINLSNGDYVESDIQEWQKQINECKKKLEQLQTDNNDLIYIDIKPIDWDNRISISQRLAVRVRTKRSIPSQPVQSPDDTLCVCQSCGVTFFVNSNCNVSHSQCSSCYSSCNDACFHGDCVALLANGLTKLVKDIRKGDVLQAADGLTGTVTFAIKILRMNKNASMVRFDNGLIITPWHPVRINGQWTFPHDIGHKTVVECQEVYNFALDAGHIIIVNGIECVTLGHNFKGAVIEHPYYGTNNVLDDLNALDIFNNGFIELLPNSIIRNNETGLVAGICRQMAPLSFRQTSIPNIIPCDEHF